MQRVSRTEDFGMSHPEPKRAITAHEISGNSSRIAAGKGSEAFVHIRHQLLDHKIFPVTRDRRIDVPGTPQRRVHIDADEDELTNNSCLSGAVKQTLCAVLVERGAITVKRGGHEVDHGITGIVFVVPRGKIDDHASYRTYADHILCKFLRAYLPVDHLTIRPGKRMGREGRKNQTQRSQCECRRHALSHDVSSPSFHCSWRRVSDVAARYQAGQVKVRAISHRGGFHQGSP